MPIIVDPRATQSAVMGEVNEGLLDTTPAEKAPPALEVMASASRIAFLPGMAYARWSNPDPDLPEAPPNYDPFDDIAGYEDHYEEFVEADTPSEVSGIKSRIASDNSDRQTLARSGLGGPVAEFALGLIDPSFYASVFVPSLAVSKINMVNKLVTAGARGAVGASAYELGAHALQETRTLGDSVLNISAGTVLSGVLGSLGRRVPRAELDRVRTALKSELTINPDAGSQSFGAASARAATTLEAESIAAGGDRFSRVVGKVPFVETDAQKILRAESIEARTVLQDLAEVAPTLSKNLDGVASPHSVESLSIRHEGRIADFLHEMRRLYREHRVDPKPRLVGTPALSRAEFETAVASAARRGDQDVFPHVRQAAQYLRGKVFDPLKHEAQKLGLLPPDSEIDLFAESYFRRMYDRKAIRARRGDWEAVLEKHFRAKGMDPAEARTATDDITRRILGADVGQANFNLRTRVKDAGPLHERVLDIRDELIEPFLVNDVRKVAASYVRELGPQIEMIKKFGDKDMASAIQRVRDEYGVLRAKAAVEGNPRRANALQDEEQETLEALLRVRDRVLGRSGALSPDASKGERAMANVLRGWRNLVASMRLGMTALTGGMNDLSRIVATEGFQPTMQKIAQLATKPAFRELSQANARRLGIATEVALARRVAVASDGAQTEGWTQMLADTTFRVTGLNHVTDFQRTLSATLIEDRILDVAGRVAAGEVIEKGLRTDLARIGLDVDALKRIHAEVLEHGETVDGIRTSGSMQWRDGKLADSYDAAIVKEARTLVNEPGAANRVWWTDGEVGKTIGQIKSFALSSPLKLTMTPVQLLGQKRFAAAARFAGSMMVGGALVHIFRQTASGVAIQTDPVALAGEAFSESGLAGVLPDLLSPISRRFGLFGESARFSDRNAVGAYGGPALGTGADFYDLVMNRSVNGINAKDAHMLRRLIPLNQVWWLRRGVNALEGETTEALGLAGATTDTFANRAMSSRPLLPSTQRGGTGTGQIVQ